MHQTIQNISVPLKDWDNGVREGKFTEQSIFVRNKLELISIECPKCNAHVWQQGNIFLSKILNDKGEVTLDTNGHEIFEQRKFLKCLTCGHEDSRLVGA